jgi:Ca-activated chloride channel family protein
MVEMLPEILAATTAFVACVAELLHSRRIHRIRHLAFGSRGKPAAWTRGAPLLRIAGLALAVWGFASLWLVVEARVHNRESIPDNEYRHLVLIVDVSPSMRLQDAGPEGNLTRRQRASDVLESLFNRIPMRQFKISVIAVYTDAKMLLEDSRDHEVVRHIMEHMPLWHAFKSGKTQLMSGIQLAARTAKTWNPGSTFVLMLSDGDTVPPAGMPEMPASVRDFLVVGVGDARAGSFIDGHQSRQDVTTLRQIANRLRGSYHNGNQKHLTSQLVGRFTQTDDERQTRPWTRREWAIVAAVAGAAVFAIVPVLLHYFGSNHLAGMPLARKSRSAAA